MFEFTGSLGESYGLNREDAETHAEMLAAGWHDNKDGDMGLNSQWDVWAPYWSEHKGKWRLNPRRNSDDYIDFDTLRALWTYCQLHGIEP